MAKVRTPPTMANRTCPKAVEGDFLKEKYSWKNYEFRRLKSL
jgi:hypothetical protein